MRWSQAESRAVQEKAAGQNSDRGDYKAAMKAAQYNQKNGWTDDGSERTSPGTPLRNNQKRGGSSSGPCLDTFILTTAVCGEGDEDITGGDGDGGVDGGGGVDVGGVTIDELGYVPGCPRLLPTKGGRARPSTLRCDPAGAPYTL
jgi:hypothetical protein